MTTHHEQKKIFDVREPKQNACVNYLPTLI